MALFLKAIHKSRTCCVISENRPESRGSPGVPYRWETIMDEKKLKRCMEEWLLEDTAFLIENQRFKSALCLLLIKIDELAKKSDPNCKNNRSRYVTYLEDKLETLGHHVKYRVEEKDDLMSLAEIIYEYIRCFFIHEGDDRSNKSYEIQLQYEDNERFKRNPGFSMNCIEKRIFMRFDWLLNLLIEVVKTEI
jgi:hypothetical protein